jgi:hypothetical protein
MIGSSATKKVYITRCYATVNDPGTAIVRGFGATGGLVGANNSNRKQQIPVIRYCWANVKVESTHPGNYKINPNDPVTGAGTNPYNIKYGGLVGCNETGISHDSFAFGEVTGVTAWAVWQVVPLMARSSAVMPLGMCSKG